MNIDDLQRIKRWHLRHRDSRPVEYHAFDAMLMLWVSGWVAWIPAYAFDAWWLFPVCALAMAAPSLYVAWRLKAHRQGRLRCDWVPIAIPAGR